MGKVDPQVLSNMEIGARGPGVSLNHRWTTGSHDILSLQRLEEKIF